LRYLAAFRRKSGMARQASFAPFSNRRNHCSKNRCYEEEQNMTRFLMAALVALALGSTAVSAQTKSPAPRSTATASAPVNLNTATADQLATIPGVGPKMAERIIDYRQKNGGFKKVEDLMNVSGVGEKSFLKMKPLITVTAARPGQ